MRAENATFDGNTIDLDGGEFIACEFRNCKLVYHGGRMPNIESCRFVDSQFARRGAAAETLGFLEMLKAIGEKEAIDKLLATVR
jgi:hypothetical protein